MQISLRSHLIAGTAAVVGASAIVMTPVTASHLNLPSVQVPSLAQVALAGFDSPISELLSTVGVGASYLFDGFQNPLNPASWPFSGIATGSGGASFAWPNPILSYDSAGGYSSVGLVPQIIDDALPIISRLGYNGSNYLDAAVTGLGGAAYILSEGVWNAAGQALKLNISQAVQTLVTSIKNAGQLALSSGQYVLSNVIANATNVVKYVVSELPLVVGATVGQIKVLTAALIKPITNLVAAFSGPKPLEGAWNAVVDGLLGPSGIPGTVLNLTIGAGVQTGPISGNTPQAISDSVKANFVPSIRTEAQSAIKGVAVALGTAPVPAASVHRAASVKAAASETAGGNSTTVSSVTAPSASNNSSSDSSAPKPSTNRERRGAAAH